MVGWDLQAHYGIWSDKIRVGVCLPAALNCYLAWQPTALIETFTEDLAAVPGVGTVSMVRVGDGHITGTASKHMFLQLGTSQTNQLMCITSSKMQIR